MRQVRCPVVVGRDAQAASITAAIDSALLGDGQVRLLVGEAGVGKSRLATVAADQARSRGLAVLVGRAVESTPAAPYRPLSEALLSALRRPEQLDATRLSPFDRALSALVPHWRNEPVADRQEQSVLLLGEAVLAALAAVGRSRGTILVLEDLQWADKDTLAVIEYVADHVHLERVVLLCTLRDEPVPALALAHALVRRRVGEMVPIQPLDNGDVARMASACLEGQPPEEVLGVLAAKGDGLPFLVEELLSSLIATGDLVSTAEGWTAGGELRPSIPWTFRESVQRRLGDLGPRARSLLNVAALLGRDFDWAIAAAASDVDDAGPVLREAVSLQLLDEAGGGFRFRHALTRDAVLHQLSAAQRPELARRALGAVEDSHPQLLDDSLELAASLAEQADLAERATELWIRAAQRGLSSGALHAARGAAERAVTLSPPASHMLIRSRLVLLEALSLAGDWRSAEAIGTLLSREAIDELPLPRHVNVHLLLARAAAAAGEWEAVEGQLDAARSTIDGADRSTAAEVEAVSAKVALGQHRIADARRHAEAARELSRHGRMPERECEVLELLGRCHRPVALGEAEAYFAEALAVAANTGLPLWRLRALHQLGTIDVVRVASTNRLNEARELAGATGAVVDAAAIDFHLAVLHLLRFELEPAVAAAARAEAAARRYRLGVLADVSLSVQGAAQACRNELREANRLGMLALQETDGDPETEATVRGNCLAVIELVQENRKAALAELDRAAAVVPADSGAAQSHFLGLRALVRAVCGVGTPDANARIQHLVGGGLMIAASAVVTGRRSDHAMARRDLKEADDMLAAAPWFRHLNRRLAAEAAIEDRWEFPEGWLEESEAFFARSGNEALARACRSLLGRTGSPRRRRRSRSTAMAEDLRRFGITTREADVLALVAEGMSNKKIAERLYLSPRTVEKHVERLLAKTGSSSRAQLVVLAVRPHGQMNG